MAKAEKQLQDLKRAIAELANGFSSAAVVSTISKKTKQQITRRTRAGFGLTSDDVETAKLKKLKIEPQTKARRRRAKKRGELNGPTTPAKANLTRTGSLVDNLEIKKLNNQEFEIEPVRSDQTKANELFKQGKIFLGLTQKELGSILGDSLQFFNKLINKINKV